jgi:hypothetical protein
MPPRRRQFLAINILKWQRRKHQRVKNTQTDVVLSADTLPP